MLLKKGMRGEEVKTLQMTLKLRGYDIGSAGADGVFGDSTEKAVKEFQRDHNLEADGIVGPATQAALHKDYSGNTDYGELLKVGSSGPQVAEMQRLLIKAGFSVGATGADGIFGSGTENAVKRFQESRGLAADGIIGPDTKNALKSNSGSSSKLLKVGARGPEVKELQRLLINTGYGVGSYGADGVFGAGTESAVKKFQAAKGLAVDGIVGPATWGALYGTGGTTHVSGGPGVLKFVRVAEAQEFHERLDSKGEGDNINPYGAWYGMNGVSWCAIFVSWCANQAGILGSVVPRYHYCEDAVNWYRSMGRYRTRPSGYIPKIGDVIFFYDASKPAPFYHTGIVTGYENGEVITTEGNAGHAVRHNLRYSRNYWRIHGYGDNGGILKPNYTQKEIGEAISKVGFAKLLGINLSRDINEVHLTRGPMEITLKTGYTTTIGKADGKITIDNGDIGVELSNGNSSLNVESIKDAIKTMKKNGIDISNIGKIIGDSIKFSIKLEKTISIKLEIETKILGESLSIIQGIEVELNDNYDETDFHSDFETELFGLISSLIMGAPQLAGSVGNFLGSLVGSIPEIVRSIIIFIIAIGLI
ncbi:peptidoglycan-binding protein [Clostridium baratii]|uniref:peptidoglycan-binding protein n=1 Tax=Clostridium baratii TaxID=1561 RepID=UPI0030CFBBD0